MLAQNMTLDLIAGLQARGSSQQNGDQIRIHEGNARFSDAAELDE